jgi:hypothetical protein
MDLLFKMGEKIIEIVMVILQEYFNILNKAKSFFINIK